MTRHPFRRPLLSLGLPGHAEVYATMKRNLRTVQVDQEGQLRTPLAALSATELSDPTLALLDAWAATAEIVAFYQDRLLNEGFLSTAVENRSLDILGRSIGFAAPAFIAATAPIGVIVPDSVTRPVELPAGSALRATPSTPGAAPQIFETFETLTATAEKSRLRPRQTRPPELSLDARQTILAGINLGLSVGDALLMVLPAQQEQGPRWLVLTITAVSINTTLNYTSVGWDGALKTLWVAAGWPKMTQETASQLEFYAMQQTLRLFGYNVPDWKKQPFAVQLANTPSGHDPFEYDDWPDFPINYKKLPLQSVYPKIVPGSKLVIVNPDVQIYTSVKKAEPTTITRYAASSQVTLVTPADDIAPDKIDVGSKLDPERTGHSATLLPDGVTVLILGGKSKTGPVLSIELFDIPSQKLRRSSAVLDDPRIDHSATLIDNAVLVFGGSGGAHDDWPSTVLTFTQIGDDVRKQVVTTKFVDPAALPTDGSHPATRAQHRATLLPGTAQLLISGGIAPVAVGGTVAATLTSVVLCDLTGNITAAGNMVRARRGHSATWCPVVAPPSWHDRPPWDLPADAAAIVIAFGTDGTTSWNDVEVFDMTTKTMSRATFPWSPAPLPSVSPPYPPPQLPAGRAFHGATAIADGILLTGGELNDRTITDECWTVYCEAYRPPEGGDERRDPETRRSLERYVPVPILAQATTMLAPRAYHATAVDVLSAGAIGTVEVIGGITSGGVATDAVEQLVLASGAPQPIPVPPSPTIREWSLARVRSTPPGAPPTSIPGGATFSPQAGALLPRPMSNMAACVISGGAIFLCGGNDQTTILDTAFIYELNASSFVQTAGPFFMLADSMAPSTTTALSDGTLLLTGVSGPNRDRPLAWIFDPATNLATQVIPPMSQPRVFGAATLLPNGTVLLSGGSDGAFNVFSDDLEIYDPVRRTFQLVGKWLTPRRFHTATLLPDGSVLIFGGITKDQSTPPPPELFDSSTMAMTPLASPTTTQSIYAHTATYLGNGNVLIAGGFDSFQSYTPTGQCFIYNCFAGAFAPLTAPLVIARGWHAAALLSPPPQGPDGEKTAESPIRVLLTGGFAISAENDWTMTAAAEIFDFDTLSFNRIDNMQTARGLHAMIATPNDDILIVGGDGSFDGAQPSSAEFYRPGVRSLGSSTPPAFFGRTSLPVVTPYAAGENWFSYATVAYIPGWGIYFFGNLVAGAPNVPPAAATGVRYVTPPIVTAATPRNTLIYAQSVRAQLAPPIDTAPVGIKPLEVPGIIPSLAAGDRLLITGLAPFAICTVEMGVVGSSSTVPIGSSVLAHDYDGTNWRVTLMCGRDALIGPLPPPPQIAPVRPGAAPAKDQATLEYLAGDGQNIGNVPPALVRTLPRKPQAEVAIVASVAPAPDGSLTTITFESPLELIYDRTTVEIYGNVVDVTQGQTTTAEILGSGDASIGFQTFSLAKVPLTRVTDPAGVIVDTLEVRIDNVPWTRVESLADAAPTHKCYTLAVDTFGRGRVTFGDGIRGARVPTGESNVTATYRVGAGSAGDLPARSLTKPPAHSPDISAVVSPIPASGGVGALPPRTRRILIPNSTQGLDRIVVPNDIFSFVRGYADIARAVLTTVSQDPPVLVVSIAGPDGVPPNPEWPSFVSLLNAMRRAAPPAYAILSSAASARVGALGSASVEITLAPYEPTYFNVGYTLKCRPGTRPQIVREATDKALRERYTFANQNFCEAVRATEIEQFLRTVDGVAAVEVDLLAYTLAEPGSVALPLTPALAARPARAVGGRMLGAQILLLNPLAGGISPPKGQGS